MNGIEDGVVNFEHMRQAVIARLGLLPGAQLIVVSSPWAASGPVYRVCQDYNGSPSRYLVLVRATGPEMNPALWTEARIQETKEQDEAAYITDVLGEFADVESGLFMSSDLGGSVTRTAPLVREREEGWSYTAGMDPAVKKNAWALVIVGYKPSPMGDKSGDRFTVAMCRQWQGSAKRPLVAKDVLTEIGIELHRYGIAEVYTDQWGSSLISQIGSDVRVTVTQDMAPQAKKDAYGINLRTRILAGQVELPPTQGDGAVLRADLLSARKRLTPNGVKIEYPVTRDGRHADFAPALFLAMAKAAAGATWVDAMRNWRGRGGV